MKLYASVTSERATKGQGGNDYLDIDIMVKPDKEVIIIGQLTLKFGETPDGDDGYVLVDEDDKPIKWYSLQTKGKKQKDNHVCTMFVHGKCATCGLDA